MRKEYKEYKDIIGDGGSNIVGQVTQQIERLRSRMEKVKHKVAVISGKGGVGKSAVTVNLASAFSMQEYTVGVLDADINGPSIAKMMGVQGQHLKIGENGVSPAVGPLNIKVMSMDLLLPSDETPVVWDAPSQEAAFIWRGTMEVSTLREFLSDTEWGELNSLFIDLPAGVEKLPNVAQLLPNLDGVVLVTIPTEVSHFVVKKSAVTAKALGIPVVGLIENMVGYICLNCGQVGDLFKTIYDGKKMADQMGIPYLGRIPFDPRISISSDKGVPFVLEYSDSSAGKTFIEISAKINGFLGRNK
ncbi:MAG: Mrp/NBP35 family ATP-binding protein [Deltaproteobacteria bacterium]|nr:Mrp/NBP35 family ATP-binding protein [Deltaproteobacteria bacterium]